MPNLQTTNNSNVSNQDEVIKCLQAIYGKNSAEILQKLPPLNDWPMQSVSPPDFPRVVAGTGIGGTCGSNNVIVANSAAGIVGNGGGASGASFNNNNNINNGNSSQQKQDTQQFANAQHSHPAASAINHFRVSTSNMHSPQQQLSQQKSVLSLHQHHQNDLSNRRLNHHHFNTTNTSFTNLATTNPAISSSVADTNNLNTFGSSISSSKNSSSAGLPPTTPNIMDTLGSMDNIFYDGSLQSNKDTSTHQQPIIRHQQLQKLLKASGSQLKSSQSSTSSNLSHRNDFQNQRNISSNNMSQIQHQLTSPGSAISPPQPTSYPSVPKSLLNLAACSSSPPNSTNALSLPSSSKLSNISSLISGRNAGISQTSLTNNASANNRPSGRSNATGGDSNSSLTDAFGRRGSTGNDSSNTLQHVTKSTTPNPSSTTSISNSLGPSTRSILKQQLQSSLLSEDQTTSGSRSSIKSNSVLNPRALSHQVQRPTPDCDATASGLNNTNSKEAYLATLQERAARAGVSIGEISKSVHGTSISPGSNLVAANQLGTISISPTNLSKEDFPESTFDRKEIESALSRVEARNDLSLLYPPMLLASNSQKQINALSAGFQEIEDSELFTKEVKRIVLEECNIIYECKECNNLFRSLANLVKHKRSYCVDQNSERTHLEMNRRSNSNNMIPQSEQPSSGNIFNNSLPETHLGMDTVNEKNSNNNIEMRTQDESGFLLNQSYNLRGRRQNNSSSDMRMLRMIRNQDRIGQKEVDLQPSKSGQANNVNISGIVSSAPLTQTSLSKLLQSQPKNRLPINRDSALMGALNMTPVCPTNDIPTNNSLSAFESDKNISCSFNDLHEQLVRNSSLAKTLLNEKVKSIDPRQSLIELSRNTKSIIQQGPAMKRAAPKRKFLEVCIQKVKRDKLRTEDDNLEPAHPSIDTNTASAKSSVTSDKVAMGEPKSPPPQETHMTGEIDVVSDDDVGDEEANTNDDDNDNDDDANGEDDEKLAASDKGEDAEEDDDEDSDDDEEEEEDMSSTSEHSSPSQERTDRCSEDSNSSKDRKEDKHISPRDADPEGEEDGESQNSDKSDNCYDEGDSDTEVQGLSPSVLRHTRKTSPKSTKPTSQTTPSSSSAGSSGAGGGIMKLKIQLKTQPDEKSKVYRIV